MQGLLDGAATPWDFSLAMMHLTFPMIAIWLIAPASILLMLVRPRGIAEVYWVCGGAVLLMVCGLIPWRQAGHAIGEGLDVYLFLMGMMVLAELAREEGVFDWVADVAAQHSHGSPGRLFLLIYVAGTMVTALLSNDATAVVLTPAVLAAVRRAGVRPKPYLLACALIANAASFVLPISNPANLVVFGSEMPALAAWLKVFVLPSIAAIVLTFVCLRLMSREELQGEMKRELQRVRLQTEGKLAAGGLVIAAAVLIGASAFGLRLGAPTCVAAVAAMLVVSWKDRGVALRVVKGVAWTVLPLVAGLFVIVQALQNAGMLRLGVAGLHWLGNISPRLASFFEAGAVALL